LILVSRNIKNMRKFAGVPQEGATNDSGAVVDDIFGYFGGYFFGNFREKAGNVSSL